jgi:hypothetical protein
VSVRKPTTYDPSRPPKIGDTCYGDAVGRLPTRFLQWLKCEECPTERWVTILHGLPVKHICRRCALSHVVDGIRHTRSVTADGYISVHLPKDSFFLSMSHGMGRRILEHRLVMAEHIKRCLLPWEVVHHKNGIRDDNRVENLQLLTSATSHVLDSNMKQYVHKLEAKIRKMEEQILDMHNVMDVMKYELNITDW